MAEAPKTDDSLERGITIILGLLVIALILAKLGLTADNAGISPGKSLHPGDTVITTATVDVLEYPSEAKLGEQLRSASGVILDGPKVFANARRFFVDFANAPDGWVADNFLSLTPDAIRLGSKVITIGSTDVYNQPGGAIIGSQPKSVRGVVEHGPQTLEDTVWWYVNFDTQPDGWVRASTILPDERESRAAVIGEKYRDVFTRIWNIYSTYALFFSFLCITVIVYCIIRIRELDHRVEEEHHAASEALHHEKHVDPRFASIHAHASSQNPNDWRQAIIESDIILDELLSRAGYHGTSVGDKLKQVRSGDLQSIESAWQAHKIRNDIAHRGSDFILTAREAQRTIGLYRQVFEELGYFG